MQPVWLLMEVATHVALAALSQGWNYLISSQSINPLMSGLNRELSCIYTYWNMKVQHVINFVLRIFKNLFDGRDNPDFPRLKFLQIQIVILSVYQVFPVCVQLIRHYFAITF